jgi:SRSO17 transposase
VGVARQYCGQTGKQDNCQVAVSLSVATWKASLPIAYRLYLPEAWASDGQRRQQARIPKEVRFETKLEIALGQIRQAMADGIAPDTALADPGCGNDTGFRQAAAGLELSYVLGIQSTTTVWPPGTQPLSLVLWKGGRGRPANRLRRDREHAPVSAKQLALGLPAKDWKDVTWREGTRRPLRSRFARVLIRPAHRDHKRPNRMRKNGCSSSGPAARPNRANTGDRIWRKTSPCATWLLWPNNAGSSNTTMRS